MKAENGKASGIRIAYIGGGSRAWAWTFMTDLAVEPSMSGEIALYDIDRPAAEKNKIIGERITADPRAVGKWDYRVADSLQNALTGADFICEDKKNALNILEAEGRRLGLSRTGYTGEPVGFELFVKAEDAVWLWQRLMELGAAPIGLGARDTLRLEAGLPLYGHEMGLDPYGVDIPIFAVSLSRFGVNFAEEKGDFVGREALLAQKEQGADRRLVPIRLTDRGVIRAGMEVYRGETRVGYITSGTMVPYFEFENDAPTEKTGKRSIGFALVTDAQVGDTLEVDVRGRRLKAEVVSRHLIQNRPPYARAVL